MTPMRARLEYALSSLGIIDLLAFLPSAIALVMRDRHALVLFGMLPFLKLVRYSPALRSLLAALHAERRTLFGCVVILTGAVLLFASLLLAEELLEVRAGKMPEPEPDPAVAETLERLADRMEQLAQGLESRVTNA